MAKLIYFGVQKNRKMTETAFRDYASSIAAVTRRSVEVRPSSEDRSGVRLDLLLAGEKIGGWSYTAALGGRGHYLIAH